MSRHLLTLSISNAISVKMHAHSGSHRPTCPPLLSRPPPRAQVGFCLMWRHRRRLSLRRRPVSWRPVGPLGTRDLRHIRCRRPGGPALLPTGHPAPALDAGFELTLSLRPAPCRLFIRQQRFNSQCGLGHQTGRCRLHASPGEEHDEVHTFPFTSHYMAFAKTPKR